MIYIYLKFDNPDFKLSPDYFIYYFFCFHTIIYCLISNKYSAKCRVTKCVLKLLSSNGVDLFEEKIINTFLSFYF